MVLEQPHGVRTASCMLRLAKFDEEFRKKNRPTLTHTETDGTKNSTALFFVSA